MSEQKVNISEEMVRQSAESLQDSQIEPGEIAPPLYDNGMSDAVRSFLSNDDAIEREVSETLSVFS